MRLLAKRSLACLATLCFVAGLPRMVVAQRLDGAEATQTIAKPGVVKDSAPWPYGGLAPLTPPPGPATPPRLDGLIARPALPLSAFVKTPYVAPDRLLPPRLPPPQQEWTTPPLPPPREVDDSRRKPRPIKITRRPQAPTRRIGAPVAPVAPSAPVTMPTVLEPTWH